MIQRKQSIFLLLAAISSVLCLCMQVGTYTPDGMGVGSKMMNLWILNENGSTDMKVCPLFVLLLMSATISLLTIFQYKKRLFQSKLCVFNMLFIVGWYVVFAVFGYVLTPEQMTFHPELAAAFPAVTLVFIWMARRAILADERLVRAADRIR